MEHYVTLFDSLFLPQGLALHMSMERHIRNYTLWILCVDDKVHEVLIKLNLPNVRLLQLSKLETEELKRVRPTRTKGEFCWTLTPFAPRFVFEADTTVARVTYLDADLWFRKHPAPIFQELDASGKHLLITEHAYAPAYDRSGSSGYYCVQFMIFTRDLGENVRKCWEEQCIEWCYERFENGKFGDQKYLDDWPDNFSHIVHVLGDKSLALAPWNAMQLPYSKAIFYHFHGLRLIRLKPRLKIFLGRYQIPLPTRQAIYKPYLTDLNTSLNLLNKIGLSASEQMNWSFFKATRNVLRTIYVKFAEYGQTKTI